MGTCGNVRKKVLASGATGGWGVERHLASCPTCSQWLANLQVADEALKRLAVPQVPADLESRLACALAREVAQTPVTVDRQAWFPWRAWVPAVAGAAAVVALVLGVSLHVGRRQPDNEFARVAQAAQVVELGVALSVAVASDEAISGAEIHFSLPAGIDLAGVERSVIGRELAWHQNLEVGKTELALGLVAFASGDHRVAVKVCKEQECASGIVVVHASPVGAQITWLEQPTRASCRFALSAATTVEDRS